jgi:hypothetical protein
VVLVQKAEDGIRSTNSLSSAASVREAAAQVALSDCLSKQAKALVPSGEKVALFVNPVSTSGAALYGAVVSWASITEQTSQASVVLALQTRADTGPGTCDGDVVVSHPGGARP